MAFTLKSPVFHQEGMIPKTYACDQNNLSPPLKWEDAPNGTQSYALIAEDPDAPPGTWVHWVLYDVPGNLNQLEEGLPHSETLPNGAKQGMAWGVNDFAQLGYAGPCPPLGSFHHYHFRLYALDEELNLPPKANVFQVREAMKGHILGETDLVGRYGR